MKLQDIANVAIVAQGVAVSLAAFFAAFQLRQNRHTRQTVALSDFFAEFHQAVNYANRERVLTESAPPIVNPLLTAAYLQTCDYFQRVGFLVRHRVIRQKFILQMYSGIIVRCFDASLPFIVHMRTDRGIVNYSQDFEWLARSSKRFRERRFGKIGDFAISTTRPVPRTQVLCAVPCFNEVRNLPGVLHALGGLDPIRRQFELLLIDDCSNDGSDALLQNTEWPVVRLPSHRGYGGVVKTALREAHDQGYKFLAVFPGDFQRSVDDLCRLVDEALNTGADLVVGRKSLSLRGMPVDRYLVNRIARWAAALLWHPPFVDVLSGFKVYNVNSVATFANEMPDDYGFDLAMSMYCKPFNLRTSEIDVGVNYGASREHALRDGVALLKAVRKSWSVLKGPLS